MRQREERVRLTRDIVEQRNCRGINISSGGMLLQVEMPIEVGDTLPLDLKIGDSTIHVDGIVRWRQADRSVFSSYECGVEFVGIRALDLVALKDFIQELKAGGASVG